MQRLILPIDRCKVNAGYKVTAYQKEWGFPHYGIDLGEATGKTAVKALGDGIVIAAGLDGADTKQRMGYAIVIVYPGVFIRKAFTTANGVSIPEGSVIDLACRIYHFARLYVKAEDKVSNQTVIGEYGATGKYVSGAHLHLEFDVDAKAPAYAYGIGSDGNVIKKGYLDTTVDPSIIWYLGDRQTVQAGNAAWMAQGWLSQKDLDLPPLPVQPISPPTTVPPVTAPPPTPPAGAVVSKAEYDALQARFNTLKKQYDTLTARIKELMAGL